MADYTLWQQAADMQQNSTDVKMSHESISINNREKELGKIKSNDIYFACLYMTKKTKCTEAWTNIFGKPIQWPKIFKSVYSSLQSRMKTAFHWKTSHVSIYTEAWLLKMNKSNGLAW